MSNNGYFGFAAGGGGSNQYGSGSGYGAGQPGFNAPNQYGSQLPPQRQYSGYEQYQQSFGQPSQRYDLAKSSNYYAQGYNQPESSLYPLSKGMPANTPAFNPIRAPAPSSPKLSYSGYMPQNTNYTPFPATNVRLNAKPSQWPTTPARVGPPAVPTSSRKLPPKPRTKQPPKPILFQYCDVCKISCAGPQTYKEHLEGQKHKKKELAAKAVPPAEPTQSGKNSTSLRCELCDVVCTGSDAYAAHIRGAKHQKVVKLHTKLGKPIPSTEPVVMAKKVEEEEGEEEKPQSPDLEDVQPVGHEYIEELRNSEWKLISFQCKLCDCKFSDPNAKEMHMKGRKHRMQYKRKVDPDLVVDYKPSARRVATRPFRGDFPYPVHLMEARYPGPPPFMRPAMPPERMSRVGQSFKLELPENGYILAKHLRIYCPEKELSKIREIVAYTEKALKGVSDVLASSDSGEKGSEDEIPPRQLRGVMKVGNLAKGLLLTGDTDVGLVVLSGDKPTKTLLMRVAELLPEQLESAVNKDKEREEAKTSTSTVAYPTFGVCPDVDEAAIMIRTSNLSPAINIKVTLTSPVMREDKESETTTDPEDVLSKEKCLKALADLRHAKWFQACASGPQSCVMLVRIFRDICRRLPAWSNLGQWPLELMIENVIASAGVPLVPAEGFRRIMGAVSSGILLPGSSYKIMDPCEKVPTDALASLSAQDREDITASAQYALRLIAFRQIHKVLGIEESEKKNFNRKRKLDNVSEPTAESDGKKDKKGEEPETAEETVVPADSEIFAIDESNNVLCET